MRCAIAPKPRDAATSAVSTIRLLLAVVDADKGDTIEVRSERVEPLAKLLPHAAETLGCDAALREGIAAEMHGVIERFVEHSDAPHLVHIPECDLADVWFLHGMTYGRQAAAAADAMRSETTHHGRRQTLRDYLKETENAIGKSQRIAQSKCSNDDPGRRHRERTVALSRAYLQLLSRDGRPPDPPSWQWPLADVTPGWEGGFQLGQGYDTNVLRLGKAINAPRGVDGRGDYWFGLSADLSFSQTREIARSAGWGRSLTWGIGGATSHIWHPDISAGDDSRYAGRLWIDIELPAESLKWVGLNAREDRGVYLGLQYEHEEWRLDRTPSLRSDRLTPTLTFVWRRDALDRRWYNALDRTMLYYTHDWRDYRTGGVRPRLDRDGQYHTIGIQHVYYWKKAQDLCWMQSYFASNWRQLRSFFYTHEWLSLEGGYEYHWARTDGAEFDLRSHGLLFGAHVPLPHRLALDFDTEFVWSCHDNPSFYDIGHSRPSEFTQRYGVALSWTLPEVPARHEILESKLRVGAWFDITDSNIVDSIGHPYDRSRAVWGVQIAVRWLPDQTRGFQRFVPTRSAAIRPGTGRAGTARNTRSTCTVFGGCSVESQHTDAGRSLDRTHDLLTIGAHHVASTPLRGWRSHWQDVTVRKAHRTVGRRASRCAAPSAARDALIALKPSSERYYWTDSDAVRRALDLLPDKESAELRMRFKDHSLPHLSADLERMLRRGDTYLGLTRDNETVWRTPASRAQQYKSEPPYPGGTVRYITEQERWRTAELIIGYDAECPPPIVERLLAAAERVKDPTARARRRKQEARVDREDFIVWAKRDGFTYDDLKRLMVAPGVHYIESNAFGVTLLSGQSGTGDSAMAEGNWASDAIHARAAWGERAGGACPGSDRGQRRKVRASQPEAVHLRE